MNRILIIDDDTQLRSMLAELLLAEGFRPDQLGNGRDALRAVSDKDYDLVILDIMMPGLDGLDVLRELRRDNNVPVLMLTARGDDTDRIAGFELGADDYLSKPFNPRELLLRIKAILKRSQDPLPGKEEELCVGPLRFEPRKHRVHLGDELMQLTGAELRILETLMRSPGKIISREELTRTALGRALTPYDRSLDTHISHLRTKLGKDPEGQSPIRSMRGAGYVLVAEDWLPVQC